MKKSTLAFALALAAALPAALLLSAPASRAQDISKETKLGATAYERVAAAYGGKDPRTKLAELRAEMPFNKPDARYRAFRQQTLDALPAEYKSLRLDEPALEQAVRRLFLPVLELYNREDAYAFVILDHPTPLFEVNSDVVVVTTTGFLRYVESDDEALGFIAHDISHRLYEKEMAAAARTYETLKASGAAGAGAAQLQHSQKMAEIELSCDAFSAVTLAARGYDANAYGRVLTRISRDFAGVPVHGHPEVAQRVKLISSLAAPAAPRVSEGLLEIRRLLPPRPRQKASQNN